MAKIVIMLFSLTLALSIGSIHCGRVDSSIDELKEQVYSSAGTVKDKASESASNAAQTVKDKASEIPQSASNAAQTVMDKAKHAAGTVKDKARQIPRVMEPVDEMPRVIHDINAVGTMTDTTGEVPVSMDIAAGGMGYKAGDISPSPSHAAGTTRVLSPSTSNFEGTREDMPPPPSHTAGTMEDVSPSPSYAAETTEKVIYPDSVNGKLMKEMPHSAKNAYDDVTGDGAASSFKDWAKNWLGSYSGQEPESHIQTADQSPAQAPYMEAGYHTPAQESYIEAGAPNPTGYMEMGAPNPTGYVGN